jgi:hypothetical protein
MTVQWVEFKDPSHLSAYQAIILLAMAQDGS